jgi:aminoglycoside N3'-acetyltransferase
MMSNALTEVLAALSVPRDRIIYIHSSMDWLIRVGINVGEALDALTEWAADSGTLVFPAFPFRGSHETYLQGKPIFDVRRTPARVGLLNETLRRRKGVMRSLDPDLSVIAFGRQAAAVVGSGFTGVDPMGADSPFQRVIELDGISLGLGVSFNYMNIVHVLDSRYRRRYPFEIYSNSLYATQTVDATDNVHHVKKQAMRDELQFHIKPSRIVSTLKPGRDLFRSIKSGDTDFFFWDLPLWEELCVTHIEQMLASGNCPCWLVEVQEQVNRCNFPRVSADTTNRTTVSR